LFTELTGKADMAGKRYLLELTAAGYPVINGVEHGIQRVDLFRTADGGLLLVEVEDLNPYLSLDRVSPSTRESFHAALAEALLRMLD
jgi:hypothetical protein